MVGDHLQPRGQHLVRLVIQADRGARQIVEQRLHPFVEQRHPVLHARMSAAVRDRQIDRILGRRLAEDVPPARAEAGDRIRVERHFGHRPQGQALPAIGAALGAGIEDADRFDRVAEQVEPHRIGLAGGEDVDDAAAHGVFARLHHRAGAAIAVGFQEARQLLRLHRAVGAQFEAGAGERGARRHALHQGVHRGQHDARTGWLLQQARQRGDALRHQRGIGRHAVVGQAVPGGEAQDLRLRHHEGQRLGQPRHARVVARDVQDGPGELATAAGEQEGVPALRGRRRPVWRSSHACSPQPPAARGGGGLCTGLALHAPQHRRVRVWRDRQAPGQPVRQVVLRQLQQCLQRRKLRLAHCVYVPLHEATEQDVVLVRPAMGGAKQQTAAPRIEGGMILVHSSARCHIAAQ